MWQTKLAARLHDPAEKALVLLRDRTVHEGDSVKDLNDHGLPFWIEVRGNRDGFDTTSNEEDRK